MDEAACELARPGTAASNGQRSVRIVSMSGPPPPVPPKDLPVSSPASSRPSNTSKQGDSLSMFGTNVSLPPNRPLPQPPTRPRPQLRVDTSIPDTPSRTRPSQRQRLLVPLGMNPPTRPGTSTSEQSAAPTAFTMTGSNKSVMSIRRPPKYGMGKHRNVELVPQPSDDPDDPLVSPCPVLVLPPSVLQ